MNKKIIFILILALIPGTTFACDLCSIYSSLESQKPKEGALGIGLIEQFTEYGKIQTDGKKIENDEHQRLSSSITQLLMTYGISKSFSLQASLPYINRRYTRLNGEMLEKGTEAGIGDITILGRMNALTHENGDFIFNLQLLGGVKLPTGNTDLLKENVDPMPMDETDHDHSVLKIHEGHDAHDLSSVHNHDLALGSGSIDFPLGINLLLEKGRAFLKGGAVYSARTKGDHSYRYADDLTWDIGPGYYMHLDHESSLAARLAVSGEHKGNDKGAEDEIHGDTSLTSLFIGPEVMASIDERLSADFGVDFPLQIDNSGTQSVASYRIRCGATYRF